MRKKSIVVFPILALLSIGCAKPPPKHGPLLTSDQYMAKCTRTRTDQECRERFMRMIDGFAGAGSAPFVEERQQRGCITNWIGGVAFTNCD